jgi:hypothetical protein
VRQIERDVIVRGIFTSTRDLSRRLLRHIKEHNRNASRSIGTTLTSPAGSVHTPPFTVHSSPDALAIECGIRDR